MKNYYIVQIFGERDLNLISSYIEKIYWEDTNELFQYFNPYKEDMNLLKDSSIVLIFDFNNKTVKYTYPIQFEYNYKVLSSKHPKKVKKMYFDEFFKLLKEEFAKGNK